MRIRSRDAPSFACSCPSSRVTTPSRAEKPESDARWPAGSILVADDDAAIRTVLNQALSRAGYEVRSTGNAATLWRWVSQGEGDLVITDVVMPDENAFDFLPRIKKLRPELPIIVMSAQNTFMTAIRASERGAYEYLPKPFDLKELTVDRRPRAGRAEGPPARRRPPSPRRSTHPAGRPLAGDAGNLPPAGAPDADRPHGDDHRRVRHRQGAGGARAARLRQAPQRPVRRHQHGGDPARAHRIRAVRPREGRLHRRQHAAMPGRFEQAEGGTLFLDEIGDMPMEAQTRLLRVLQQGEYTTVGGRTPIKTNVRIIAATNKDLRILIQQGAVPRGPVLPPQRRAAAPAAAARARRGHPRSDPPLLRRRPSARACRRSRSRPAAIERLKRYRWPGNVRELENLARRLAALYPQETITTAVIDSELAPAGAGAARRRDANRGGPLRRGRAPSHQVFRRLRRRPAAARALPPHPAGDRISAAVGGAGRHAGQPDPRRRTARREPQHVAQEDPRPGDPGHPHQQLSRRLGPAAGSADAIAA